MNRKTFHCFIAQSAGLFLFLFPAAGLLAPLAFAEPPQPAQTSAPATEDAQIKSAANGKGYVLHVTSREVVVEVVARGHDNHPINDLSAADFEVFEGAHKESASLRKISGFRVIDPDSPDGSTSILNPAVVLPLGGRCEIRSTLHYELAFHPRNWSGGVHTIRVSTSRRHVNLSYRTQFYVGLSDVPQTSLQVSTEKARPALQNAACYHSDVPPSIPLTVPLGDSANANALSYILQIAPDSLALAGIDESSRQIQLDYGICIFGRSGRAIGFWQARLDRAVSAAELSKILDTGLREGITIPRKEKAALARLVVLEPKSGNLGIIDLAVAAQRPTAVANSTDIRVPGTIAFHKDDRSARVGSRVSLGSVVPAPEAFCGDVYELPMSTTFLPSDFRALNSVGSVFSDAFNVAEQPLQQGLPGSTSRTEWFGVDYYGEFWVSDAGKYEFELTADDGADLYIDDHKVIGDDGIHPPQTMKGAVELAAGRHTIHLPYFEGPKYVSLTLEVMPPNGSLKVFDMRDYPRPSASGK